MHARYRLGNVLDQGGMGTIYRAYDRLTDSWVALKQLTFDLEEADTVSGMLNQASLRTALAEEFRLLATLRHPNIVAVIDYGFLQHSAFFTMELLNTTATIVEAAQSQPFEIQLRLVSQLFQALEYIRRHHVVHRDLKPSNVLVLDGQVKVLDFGLAVLEGHASDTAGSVFYMAPEVLKGQLVTHAADLFAAGVLTYEIFAGRRPFEAHDLDELITQISTREPDYTQLSGPAQLWQPVLAQLLAKDPAQRFATAGQVLTALANAGARSGLIRSGTQPLLVENHATRASFIQAAAFVGREAELAQLTDALNLAAQGKGSAWLLGGANGVGKSRLLEELRVRALVGNIWVWHGQALGEGSQPAQPWRTILRWLALAATLTPLEASVLKPFVPQLEEILGQPVPDAPPLEGAAVQDRFCATVVELVRRVTTQQPLVLLLEDLHWIGPLSLTLLNWLTRVVGELRVMVIGTYRDDEQPSLPTQLPHMAVRPLQPLSMPQITALTSTILGEPTAELTHLATFLYHETEGNAFFLVEALRSLAEQAGLLSAVTHMPLPEHVIAGGAKQIVQERQRRLGAADRTLLEMAAIGGRQLDLPVLRHLAPEANLAQWLSRCADVALLRPVGAAWEFAHDQLWQGALALIQPNHQEALHQTVAEAIEQVYAADLTPQLDRLVYHYAQTKERARHIFYLEAAGHAAKAAFANAEAERYFTQALTLTPARDLAQRYDLLMAREQVYDVQGLRVAQAQDLQTLTQLTEALGDPVRQIQVALSLSAYAMAVSDFPEAIAAAQFADTLAQKQNDLVGQATAQLRWGAALWQMGEYTQAHVQLETALTLARAAHATTTEIDTLLYLGRNTWRQQQLHVAQDFATQGLQLARTSQDRRREAELLGLSAVVTQMLGNCTAAFAYYAQALQLTRAIGQRLSEAVDLNNCGWLYASLGQFDQAQTHLEHAARLAHEVDNRRILAFSELNLGHVLYVQGKAEQAHTLLQHSLELFESIGIRSEQGHALTSLGYTHVALRRPQQAAKFFQQAIALRQELNQPALLAESRAGLAWTLLLQNQLDGAMAEVEQVLQYLATGDVSNAEKPMLIYLNTYRILRAQGDPRAHPLLARAYVTLKAQAAQYETEYRYSFLENIPWHREIMAIMQTKPLA